MQSPWEGAIPQAMQQHGGRNRPAMTKPAPEAASSPIVHAPGLAPVSDGPLPTEPSPSISPQC